MSNKYKALAEFIKELIRKEIAEASVTGNIDGGAGPPKTPYAFRNPKDDDKDEDDLKLSNGMKIAENYICRREATKITLLPQTMSKYPEQKTLFHIFYFLLDI